MLSLSWSPSYCEVEGENANRQQCESGRRYAFVVHGLWPQYERGWPEDCATDEPSVDNATLSSLYDIMPSAGLIRHQWRKHGTCSGLSQDDYFRVLRAARERVEIPGAYAKATTWRMIDPNQIERDFLSDNNGLMENALAVTCDDRYLREVRMCLTIGLDYRPCPEVDRRSCTLTRAAMPSARGR
ncbi:MAG: ribonuclease [Rhizobiaceae bacterium]